MIAGMNGRASPASRFSAIVSVLRDFQKVGSSDIQFNGLEITCKLDFATIWFTGNRDRLNCEVTEGPTIMTSEILYLAAQFQRWVNQQVARHLEAEAAKFAR
jgi:hypothetical protein